MIAIAACTVFTFGCAGRHAEQPMVTSQPGSDASEEDVMDLETAGLYPGIAAFVQDRVAEFDRIESGRKTSLEALAQGVAERMREDEPVRLTFICTHNSRRSHMSQLWAQTAAHVYRVEGIETFSGGTEATAFNPRAAAAMQRAGFEVTGGEGDDNPVYRVRFADDGLAMACFSKVYDHAPNPDDDFFAVMTCSAADAACPIVYGAIQRVSNPYDDPKAFDGSDREQAAYDERCRQIAREMLYLFSRVGSS